MRVKRHSTCTHTYKKCMSYTTHATSSELRWRGGKGALSLTKKSFFLVLRSQINLNLWLGIHERWKKYQREERPRKKEKKIKTNKISVPVVSEIFKFLYPIPPPPSFSKIRDFLIKHFSSITLISYFAFISQEKRRNIFDWVNKYYAWA